MAAPPRARMMRSPTAIPPWPLALGAAGLLPFVALAGLAVARSRALEPLAAVEPAAALIGYGAVILSFLGGIRWGVALGRDGAPGRDYILSVLPSLAAWGCLALPRTYGLAALGLLILALGLLDQDMPRRGLAPAWFGRLRIALSVVAGASLLAAAAA